MARSGQELGHYTIGDMIGSGGMGEVYRARDTRLGRDVALKFLPEAFNDDEARLARFKREAQLLAQLHHPHIASIFGLEESGGVRALAMELVEGPTLAERLDQGAPSLEECLSIARQIAEAVEAAHGKGIIHRDLKPLNIKLTEDGNVKVLDFGLAKAMDPATDTLETASDSTESPTLTTAGTLLGVIMGSAPYMSPEQAKGTEVDERADIWGFGVVLYEMLSGKRLFTGDSVPETLAGVLKTEIDFDDLRPDTPASIRRLLRRCLQRKRKQRLHHIADARLVIDDAIAGTDEEESQTSDDAGTPATRTSWLWPVALVLVAAAAGLIGYLTRPQGPTPSAPLHLSVQLSPGRQLIPGNINTFTFSPDGEAVFFAGSEGGRKSLFRRALSEREATRIEGTDDGTNAFLSPDGRWLGFTMGGKLMKVPVEGGRPFTLAESRGAGGATWLSDDTLVFAPIYSDGLFRIPVAGGTAERLTTPERDVDELGHWWPQPLPGEKKIVFTGFRTPLDQSRVGVLDLDTGEIQWVVDGGFYGRYVPSGHLLYAKGSRLYAVPFDPVTATVRGKAVAVLDDLGVSQTGGSATYAVSSRGTLAYTTGAAGDPFTELVWLERDGRATAAIDEPKRFLSASLSPDNSKVALTILDTSRDLWLYSFTRGTLSRLTSSEDTEFDPAWSHDASELFYVVDSPPFELHRIAAGRPDSGVPIFDEAAEFDATYPGVSPDGRTLAYVLSEPQTGSNLYTRTIDGSEPQRVVRAGRSDEIFASFSPDGQWIVYQSDETGRNEIYVEPFPGPGERVQVSADGGTEPLWARNGEIFYRRDDEFRVIPSRPGDRPEFETSQILFEFSVITGVDVDARVYDVTADGKRILAVTVPAVNQPRQIEVVTHWTGELERLAPAD